MVPPVKKKTHIRRGAAEKWDVRRGPGGDVTMIRLLTYRDNPTAPRTLVTKVGGIYRTNGIVQVTFVDEVVNAEGITEAIAANHLMWRSESLWLEGGEEFRWLMREFTKGSFSHEGSHRKQ